MSDPEKADDLSTARLGSLAKECNALKDEYEQCFFEFFPRFLYGEKFKEDPCASQLQRYRNCLRSHLEASSGVDLEKIDSQHMSADEIAAKFAQASNKKK